MTTTIWVWLQTSCDRSVTDEGSSTTGHEQRKATLAADEVRKTPASGPLMIWLIQPPRPVTSGCLYGEDRDRIGKAVELYRANQIACMVVADSGMCGLVDQDRVGHLFGVAFKPGCEVHLVADAGIGRPLLGPCVAFVETGWGNSPLRDPWLIR